MSFRPKRKAKLSALLCKPPIKDKEVSKELLEERIANLENVLMGHRKELEFMEEGDDMYDRVVEHVIHEVKNSTLLLPTYSFSTEQATTSCPYCRWKKYNGKWTTLKKDSKAQLEVG